MAGTLTRERSLFTRRVARGQVFDEREVRSMAATARKMCEGHSHGATIDPRCERRFATKSTERPEDLDKHLLNDVIDLPV